MRVGRHLKRKDIQYIIDNAHLLTINKRCGMEFYEGTIKYFIYVRLNDDSYKAIKESTVYLDFISITPGKYFHTKNDKTAIFVSMK